MRFLLDSLPTKDDVQLRFLGGCTSTTPVVNRDREFSGVLCVVTTVDKTESGWYPGLLQLN